MIQKLCKDCHALFTPYNTLTSLCNDCAMEKAKLKPKKRGSKLNHKGKVTKQWLEVDRPRWIKNNPPNHAGYWECYLMIAPKCPRWLTNRTLTIDHVKARSRHPSKRSKQQNLKPACRACNTLKGSRSLAEVRKIYKNADNEVRLDS